MLRAMASLRLVYVGDDGAREDREVPLDVGIPLLLRLMCRNPVLTPTGHVPPVPAATPPVAGDGLIGGSELMRRLGLRSKSNVQRWVETGCPYVAGPHGKLFDEAQVKAWRAGRGRRAGS